MRKRLVGSLLTLFIIDFIQWSKVVIVKPMMSAFDPMSLMLLLPNDFHPNIALRTRVPCLEKNDIYWMKIQ